MKQFNNFLLLIVISLLLSGCLEYDEKMKLNSNFSGELTFAIGISEELYNLGGESPELKNFDENKMKESYSNKKGIKFISSRSYSEGGNKWMEIKISFDTIEDLLNSTTDSTQKGMIGEISISEDKDGNFVYSRNVFGNETEQDSSADEMSQSMMDMMFGKYQWKFELGLPSKIISSNAKSENVDNDKNIVKWTFPLSSLSTKQLMTVTFENPNKISFVNYIIGFIVLIIAAAVFILLLRRKNPGQITT
ncbi:MAG: hypothetical protein AB1521_11705 [Bacteroidota bacterium]